MSIQAIMNKDAIDMLPKISKLIIEADQHTANNMKSIALRQIINTRVCLSDMTNEQKIAFDDEIIEIFKHKKLI